MRTDSKNANHSDELQTSMTLVREAQAFDDDAWRRLVEIYTPLIRFWCAHKGVKGHDGGDCCQEVFLRTSRRLPFFKKTKATHTFRGWLRAITNAVVYDHYRKRYDSRAPIIVGDPNALDGLPVNSSHSESSDSEQEKRSTKSSMTRDERYLLARRVIAVIQNEFSSLQTNAFFDVVMHQRKPRDVAEDLKTSVNNIYKAKCRILARIRKLFPDLDST